MTTAPPLLLVVGSTSAIKQEAVRKSFPDAKVETLPEFASAVPPQPVGRDQTVEGARYRAQKAREMRPEADMCFGIENGMFQEDGKWVDAAAIVIILKDGKEVVLWSDTIDIPDDMERSPLGEWSIYKDPHSIITNGKRPRAQFIADAIIEWKKTAGLA